jgi:hypothetical protein
MESGIKRIDGFIGIGGIDYCRYDHPDVLLTQKRKESSYESMF